jgi:hypothetical protein
MALANGATAVDDRNAAVSRRPRLGRYDVRVTIGMSAHVEGVVTRTEFGCPKIVKPRLGLRPRWPLATPGRLHLGRRGACGGT